MITDFRHAPLSALIADADAIATDVRATFTGLTPEQLNWQPRAAEWSVAQCFDHLIMANTSYFPVIRRQRAGERRPRLLERTPGLPGLFGSFLIKALDPRSATKLQAPEAWRPAHSAFDSGIVARFLACQDELVELMRASQDEALLKTIITSPSLSFVVYSLLDAYRIIVVHEHLHRQQMQQVMSLPGFPTLTRAAVSSTMMS